MITKFMFKFSSFLAFFVICSIPGVWTGWQLKGMATMATQPISCVQSISDLFGGNK